MIEVKTFDLGNPPCNGCRRCCIGDAVRLLPHERAEDYETEPHPYAAGQRMLAHDANGHCIYLGEEGCTIYDRRPQQCRDMDCRLIARRFSYTQARKLHADGRMPYPVWAMGRALLRCSDPNDI